MNSHDNIYHGIKIALAIFGSLFILFLVYLYTQPHLEVNSLLGRMLLSFFYLMVGIVLLKCGTNHN